jgi:hypothetical protein
LQRKLFIGYKLVSVYPSVRFIDLSALTDCREILNGQHAIIKALPTLAHFKILLTDSNMATIAKLAPFRKWTGRSAWCHLRKARNFIRVIFRQLDNIDIVVIVPAA